MTLAPLERNMLMASYSLLEYSTAAVWYCGVHGLCGEHPGAPHCESGAPLKSSTQRSTISHPAVLITTTFGT